MARRVCCAGGKSEGFRDWCSRITRRSPWFYEARQNESDTQRRIEVIRISVEARPSPDDSEHLCPSGHWVPKGESAKRYYFHSRRAADEYVRRLNNGIPIRLEGFLVVAGTIIAAAEIVVAAKVLS